MDIMKPEDRKQADADATQYKKVLEQIRERTRNSKSHQEARIMTLEATVIELQDQIDQLRRMIKG